MAEPETPNVSNQSYGVDVNAQRVDVGRDIVGRDKIESAGGHLIHAEAGATVIVGEHLTSISQDLSPTPGEPPFKGLQYFDTADADLFFGRELLTAKLTGLLREQRFLAVVGASGSGKSSVVRAGLIPALKCGEQLADGTLPPTGSPHWPVHVIAPTAHPLEALAASLTQDSESVTATTTLMDDLARDPRSLHLAIRRVLSHTSAERLLLVVDQFEELFTLCRSDDERKAFVDNLITAATPETGGPTIVVITLRADFYAHCGQFDNLREALERWQAYIGSMSTDELRRAIEEPAKRNKWKFETGLIDLLLRDAGVGNEPGALPLLSHALLETWKRRHGRSLTLTGYAESGGVHGAIAQTAESVFSQLKLGQQAIARSIFLRLIEPGEGTQDTRRRATLHELISRNEDRVAVEGVIKTLADARLVTTEKDTAELAHEALIRGWKRLRDWLQEDRVFLQIRRRLIEAAEEWNRHGRDPSYLYRGARLSEATDFAYQRVTELSLLETQFVDASLLYVEHEVKQYEDRIRAEEKLIVTARQLRITNLIVNRLNTNEILPAILEEIRTFTDASVARVVHILQPDADAIVSIGLELKNLAELDRLLVAGAVRTQDLFFVEDQPESIAPFESAVAKAVRVQNRALAVVWLGHLTYHQYTSSEINLIETLIDQLAVSFEKYGLYKEAERDRRNLQAVVTSTSDAMIVTDKDNRVLLCNPATEAAFHLKAGTSFGQLVTDVWPDLSMQRLFARGDEPKTRTAEIALPDGRTLYGSASAIISGDNQVIGRVAVLRDITHLKELDAMKSELVATVGHDLRAPLTYMRGYATMLPMVGSLTPKQQDYAEKVMFGIEQVTELIDDLLDLGRIEAGVGIVRETCALADIVRTVTDSMTEQALSRGLTLRLGRMSERVIHGDQGLLRHAIANLVDNALKYTPTGGSITVSVEECDEAMVVAVKDTGIGIAPADQVRLFERFYRVKRRETIDIKGTGLGLAIVKSIAEWHKGRVWVESQLDEGATFYFFVPVD